ncbi:MAG: hypothetical protein KKD01_16140 [Proteobacteria bacterium]|nr:hypothetical protein [Pseudomonadota bacterium]MBU1138575.1 hypothetical protein [Pseudomonadota bacterium]MBU1418539.1 hypothetical protein [Pseudomonadota bacterium]MBU1456254.1 hypothetical protein [Pseudomonadota bacterium]
MREFSLAQGLHAQLLGLAVRHQAVKIRKAEICVGSNAGIVVDSFNCGLNALIKQNVSTRDMDLVIRRDSSNDLMLMSVELE